MHGTHRMTVVLGRALKNEIESAVELLYGVRLVRLQLLDFRAVQHGCVSHKLPLNRPVALRLPWDAGWPWSTPRRDCRSACTRPVPDQEAARARQSSTE